VDADELFIAGTTTEVVPLLSLDGRPVGSGKPGPIATRIQELYRAAAGID
jgi:D-alanine transaminase